MTQIASFIPASGLPGEVGVHSLDHFSLTVPNLGEAAKFYTDFGIEVLKKQDYFGLCAFGTPHEWARMEEGPRKKLHYLSFGAFEEDFPRFCERLDRLAIKRLSPPKHLDTGGLWFRDPDGTLVEIKICEKSSPHEKPALELVSSPANTRGAVSRREALPTRPKRLAHVLFFATSVERTIGFYAEVLGLRLSDRSKDDVAFMHGIHGSDHHMIAFARSAAPGFHHCSWTVQSLDEIGCGAMHMANCGFSAGWGFGRHVIGSNYFHYVRDPWGSYSEYCCDIDYIAAGAEWNARDYPAEDRSYLWGAARPADFGFNHESVPEMQTVP